MPVRGEVVGAWAPATAMQSLDADIRVEPQVGPALVLYGRLLTLAGSDLAEFVARELERNPALDQREPVSCPDCGRPLWRRPCVTCRGGRAAPMVDEARSPAPRSSAEELLADVAPLLDGVGLRVAAYVVADLDGWGLLDRPLEDVAAALDVDLPVVEGAVAALRRVGPCGIAARDVREMLHLQLDELERAEPVPELVHLIVNEHLEDLADRGVDAVADGLGRSAEEVENAVAFLRDRLRPILLESDTDQTIPASPDVVARWSADGRGLEVEVISGPWTGLVVSDAYREFVATGATPEQVTARRQLSEARAFLDLLARRDRTLLRIATYVLACQQQRLHEGRIAHVPLTRHDVAAALGLHDSTVSRAVSDKYVQLPNGQVVPFAELFGGSIGAVEALRILLAADEPRSDRELAVQLAAQGFRVARRTVAKYRARLGIPAQRRG
jgi:RNA polymerase sigma-54 factor